MSPWPASQRVPAAGVDLCSANKLGNLIQTSCSLYPRLSKPSRPLNPSLTPWRPDVGKEGQKYKSWGFPGGSVVKNLPANAGKTGLIPGL